MSEVITVSGSVTAAPPTSANAPTLSKSMTLTSEQTRQVCFATARDIASPSAFVDLLTGTGITTVTFISIRISSGALDVRMTTSSGVDQSTRCSSQFVWSSPNSGDGATALAVQGTASFEIIVAGD